MAGLFQKWPDEVKKRALVLSETLGVAEASARTGVPEGTIQRWREALSKEEPPATGDGEGEGASTPAASSRPSSLTRPALKQAAAEAFAEARQEVLPHVVKRLAERTAALCELNRQSTEEWQEWLTKLREMRERGEVPSIDEVRTFRALIGSATQAAKQAYLAAGVPANRIELVGKLTRREEHEINVIHRIISDPAALDIGDQLLERLASIESGGAGLDN